MFSTCRVAAIASRALHLDGRDAAAFAIAQAASRSEHHLQVLREHRPGRWRPAMRLTGEGHLRQALDCGGRGAVLWIAHFSFNALAAKKALARVGYRVWHVSRPEHGFSKTRFGMKAFNPIRVRAELRYLSGRIVIDRADPEKARSAVAAVLRANGIVSITAGAWEGRRIAEVELLGGKLELASGAPAFAFRHGAALLPVFTTRSAAGAIEVEIGAPITAPAGLSREAQYAHAAQAFARQLEPRIYANPEQWRAWKNLELDEAER
jgi:lauroyl/myristoyl acyltransferase